jgi:hypothetical protein
VGICSKCTLSFLQILCNVYAVCHLPPIVRVARDDGARLCLWTAATNGPIVIPPGDMSMESHSRMILTGGIEERGEKPVPVTLCPPQIPQKLTRASSVIGRRLTAWAIAWPPRIVTCFEILNTLDSWTVSYKVQAHELRGPLLDTCNVRNASIVSLSSRLQWNRPLLACSGLMHPGAYSVVSPDFLCLLVHILSINFVI